MTKTNVLLLLSPLTHPTRRDRGRSSVAALGACFVAALFFSSTARAQTTLTITGTVTSTSNTGNTLPSGINVGDAVTTTVTYTTPQTSDFSGSTQTNAYTFLATNFTFQTTIGGYTWTNGTEIGNIYIINNGTNLVGDTRDQFNAGGGVNGTPATYPGAIPGGASTYAVTFTDQTNPYDLVTGFSLPRSSSDINFSASTLFNGSISSSTGANANWGISFSANAVFISTASAIPEFSSVPLLIGVCAFGVAGFVQKRRRDGVISANVTSNV
jgi:hypothetical protein